MKIRFNYIFFIMVFAVLLFVTNGCNNHECSAEDWIYPENFIEYKCGEEVTIYKFCNICNSELESKTFKKEHNITENIINPTCESEGYTLKTCSNCDYTVKENITNKLNHELNESYIEPTCTQDGFYLYECINCDYTDKSIQEAKLNHLLPDNDEWVILEDNGCEEDAVFGKLCLRCSEILETNIDIKFHDYQTEIISPTCENKGYTRDYCSNCDYEMIYKYTLALGHQNTKYVIDKEPNNDFGIRHLVCTICNKEFDKVNYLNNGYDYYGKLFVRGTDLVNQKGEKVQLIGLSTHGLQWAGKYVNFNTFESIHSEFGINVVRLSLYTSEDGYCDSTKSKQEELYNLVCDGIDYATKLGMYVIVDWHMVGAEDPNDKNPLYYLEESKEFFRKITTKYQNNHNILYEIMNEPCGDTTWEDCKEYANEIIPIIREKTSNIILVGNPLWTSDLYSVMKSPLTGYNNIMYTYHFYANGHNNTKEVEEAYDSGIPVFISEHGGMESSGDGPLDISSITNWYNILDKRNISYVAWNISNTKGSASILKTTISSLTNFTDDALKEWGIWYKKWVINKMINK